MWKTVDTNLLAECLERQDVIASAAFMYGPNTPLPLTRLTNHQQLRDACLALHEVLTSPKVKAWFAVNKLWFSRYTELVHQLADPPYACRDRLYSAACSRDDGRRNKATAAQKHWGLDWFRVIPTEPTVRAPAEASVESCLATPRYVLFNLANTGTWFTTNVLEVFRRYHDYSDHEDFTMLCDVRLCTARPAAPNLVVVKFNPLTAKARARGLSWGKGPERFCVDYARQSENDHWDGLGSKPKVTVRVIRRSHPIPKVEAAAEKLWSAGLRELMGTAVTARDAVLQALLRGVAGLEHATTEPSTVDSEWWAAHPEQSPLFRVLLGATRQCFLFRCFDEDYASDAEGGVASLVEKVTLRLEAAQATAVLAVAHKLQATRAIRNPYKRPVLRETEINEPIAAWDALKIVSRRAWTVRQPLWRGAGCGLLESPNPEQAQRADSGIWTHDDEYNYRTDGRPGIDWAAADRKNELSVECGGWLRPVTCPTDCDCARCVASRMRGQPNKARYHTEACRDRDVWARKDAAAFCRQQAREMLGED